MWPFSQSSACDCASYSHLTLERAAISKRIKQSKALKKRLHVVAEDAPLGIALFRCPECGELWQSGREWHFANAEYLFRVPSIIVEEWQREHYQQPAAMMIYTALMADYYSRPFTPSLEKCRADGCNERASAFSVFCRKHQVEELQRTEKLPKPPQGRLFAPYHESETG